jgi:hypothetical protein
MVPAALSRRPRNASQSAWVCLECEETDEQGTFDPSRRTI